MDDSERDYLVQHVQGLERASRWWKATVFALMAVLGLVILLVVGGMLTFSLFATARAQAQRDQAIKALLEARDQADQARAVAQDAEMAARVQAERQARKAAPQRKVKQPRR